MAVSDTIRWNAAAFQTKSFFCNTCVVRFVSLYYLTAIRYRAGGTGLARGGGSHAAPILGRKRRKPLSFKRSYIFSYLPPSPPDFQAFRRHCVTRTMASSSNQRNDSKFTLLADPILGRNRRNGVVFKRFLLLTTCTQYPQIFRPSTGTAAVINGTTQF